MLNSYTDIIPTRWGNMVSLKCDSHISGSLSFYGESTIDEVNVCASLVNDGDTVLDIGANIGTFTVPLALAVGRRGTVVSFEPQRIVYQCLCANLAINSLSDYVDPIRAAVGDTNGTASIPLINPFTKDNNVGGVRINQKADASEDVPMVTVDSLGMKKVGLIKIDVEGYEHKVLAGADKTILSHTPHIFAECLPDDHENKTGIVTILGGHGYVLKKYSTYLFNPGNVRFCRMNIFGEQANHNVIAIHKDKVKPDWFNSLPNFE